MGLLWGLGQMSWFPGFLANPADLLPQDHLYHLLPLVLFRLLLELLQMLPELLPLRLLPELLLHSRPMHHQQLQQLPLVLEQKSPFLDFLVHLEGL